MKRVLIEIMFFLKNMFGEERLLFLMEGLFFFEENHS